MEMQKRTPAQKRPATTEKRKVKGRDKLEMAWRHKSRSEKNLIRVIALLIFALACFIIAVIAMDLGFKAKIHRLENEIDDLKADEPNTTLSFSTTEESDFNYTSTTITQSTEDLTTIDDNSTTTSEEPSTTDDDSTTTTEDASTTLDTTTGDSNSTEETAEPLFEALRALLTNVSGFKKMTKSIERKSHKGGLMTRSHGTFIIMADINHEETLTPSPDVVYIDGNASESRSPPQEEEHVNKTITELDPSLDDTEEDSEDNAEGSGDGMR